jgi:subtilase family serine protease
LNLYYYKSGLAVGASSSLSITLVIPTTVAPGTYYLGAYADYQNVVAESIETNNTKATTATIQVQ